jgi:dTDP-4-dehydrorhamnose reductase
MKWLITGASGLLGNNLCKHLTSKGHIVVGLYKSHSVDIINVKDIKMDLIDPAGIRDIISETAPDVIVYTAGRTNVDACENNMELAKLLHTDVPRAMAVEAKIHQSQFVSISTDHLWDGKKAFITEDTPANPINTYALTKHLGEKEVLEVNPKSLIIRTNFFGLGRPWRNSFSDWVIKELTSEKSIAVFTDSFFTPIGLTELNQIIEELVLLKASGIYNVAGGERISKYKFAHHLANHLGLRSDLIKPSIILNAKLSAPRPPDMSLSVEKIEKLLGKRMPTLNECFKTLALEINTNQ